ncbi:MULTISPECIES: DUF6268 family outer membrane beta-barrel protein [Altibacter]|uniref:DUF6268 family outer membrane beta-barrel protein n=1 Tax=Altibacter TaxID=1535231 RepID=UPI0005581074|nr:MULTISPECIES: DUF6268 family outer membrane beta-barrel protein [Altibacter]MCW8981513.1 DUF6268 family outer membrane beta-barrel protein [Altibacter sp.]MCW9036599.1 DUF6268 family outer membrane beta-barrel protein [Altibacter sp.]
MKKILLVALLLPLCLHAQEYVDLIRIGYGQTFNNTYVDAPGNTFVKSFEADITLPVVLNEKHAFITGIAFSRNNLQLYPKTDADIFYFGVGKNNFASLYSTTLKLGLASAYNDVWSSTIVLLPKIASDYEKITGDDFYFGGLALLKYQKTENLKYRFGFYATSEAFGLFTTPIVGWYYLSPSTKFEMDMSLPIAADISYSFDTVSVGLDYFGIGRSFRLYGETETSQAYVDLSSLEFASYVQFNTLQKQVLLRAKFGYSSNNFEVYPDGETIDLGLSAFSFGDDRTQLNPDLNGGFFLKFEAIYRFSIASEENEENLPREDN